jgi:hypothetical protein
MPTIAGDKSFAALIDTELDFINMHRRIALYNRRLREMESTALDPGVIDVVDGEMQTPPEFMDLLVLRSLLEQAEEELEQIIKKERKGVYLREIHARKEPDKPEVSG